MSDVANGDVVYSSGTTFGSTATHVCNHGYTLMGSSTRVCQQNGTWTGVTANCAGTKHLVKLECTVIA